MDLVERLLLGAAVLFLIALNAFFVLGEFAIVRVRPTRVAELAADHVPGAHTLGVIQKNLDEHLGVCQLGITLASVALGVIGQRAAELLAGRSDHAWYRYVLAMAVSYTLVTGSHVVFGEMIPKAIAIRAADRIALHIARPLRAFRAAFYPALWLFNGMATLVTRVLRLPRTTDQELHTEQELRIILEHFEERGHISFRRLLVMESIFDFGNLLVKDVMRPRAEVRWLRADAPWAENLSLIRTGRFSRYPLVGSDPDNPIGYLHIKDVLLRGGDTTPDLMSLARPCTSVLEGATLESLLAQMQRGMHAALVRGASGAWTGFVTMEDVVEEIVGTIRDEFDDEQPVRWEDALDVDRIQLDVEGDSPVAAVRVALGRLAPDALPFPAEWLALAVEERESTAGTYMGGGVAIPHARLARLAKPFVMIVRSTNGIPCAGTRERAYLLFVIITPAGQPRVHQRLLQIVAMILQEGHHVTERLRLATTPAEVLDILRAGEQASVDRLSMR